ncbi:DUF4279 domain-containing protein [Microbulbifer echini]|uniref:DUF4279 domain-containing protein n=1 Tax=Microbulbifer echini TaxID=1529067 RepID=A0ABV4NS95_9GAMM
MFGDDLIPEEVTELLGVEPSQSYKMGDERPRGSQYYKTGGWLIKSGEVPIGESREGEEKFEEWLSELPDDKFAWSSLIEKFEIKARLVGYTDQWNADYTISPGALNESTKRGLPLMIDPFLSLDEPDV